TPTAIPLKNRQVRLHDLRLAFHGDDAGFVGGDGAAGRVAKLAGLQVERPGMPGADDAAVFDRAAGEVSAGVGAVVVRDKDFALIHKDAKLKPADFDVLASAFFKFAQVAKGGPGHN